MAPGLMLMVLGLGSDPLPSAPDLHVVNAWQVRVSAGTVRSGRTRIRIPAPVTLEVAPPAQVEVAEERYDKLPVFDPGAAPWAQGVRLRGLVTEETTVPDMVVPESVVVTAGPGNQAPLKEGIDFAFEHRWATIGRLQGGVLGAEQPVWVRYRFGRGRIDSIVVDRKGGLSVVRGTPHNATPLPPQPASGSVTLANIWVPGRLSALSADNLYPIQEARFPEPGRGRKAPAESLLPRTWARLRSGQPVHVLAWGDSVTAGGQASDEAHRYQDLFVARLHRRFPAASLQLTTVGWGGRNSDSFLQQPPGAPYNFEETVLKPHPDLIVMEFVNDAYLSPEQVEARYSMLLERFRQIGAEWIILTPHFVRPDWMGATTVRVEQDPRPYVAGLRAFAAKHHVALADASLRWGHLLKEGIPYVTLLSNSINHPDDRGHALFASALMELFGPD